MATRGAAKKWSVAHLPIKEQVAMAENEGIESFIRDLWDERGCGLSPVIADEHAKHHGEAWGGFWYQWAQDWLHGRKRDGRFLLPLLAKAMKDKEDNDFVATFLQSPAEYRQHPENIERLDLWTDTAECGVFYYGRFFTADDELRTDAELKRLGAEIWEYLEEGSRRGVTLYDGHRIVEFDIGQLGDTIVLLNDVAGGEDTDGYMESTVDTWIRKNISKRELT